MARLDSMSECDFRKSSSSISAIVGTLILGLALVLVVFFLLLNGRFDIDFENRDVNAADVDIGLDGYGRSVLFIEMETQSESSFVSMLASFVYCDRL